MVNETTTENTTQRTARYPKEYDPRLEEIANLLSKPDEKVTIAQALRTVISAGIVAVEENLKIAKPSRGAKSNGVHQVNGHAMANGKGRKKAEKAGTKAAPEKSATSSETPTECQQCHRVVQVVESTATGRAQKKPQAKAKRGRGRPRKTG